MGHSQPTAAQCMPRQADPIEIAKAIHHIVRQPEQAKELVEHLFDVQSTKLRDRPQQIRQALPPLPPLPEGAHLPLALLLTQPFATPPAPTQENTRPQKETPHEPR